MKSLCAALVLGMGLAAPAMADEITVKVEGRTGPFPVDEAGAAGITALTLDYEVTLPVASGAGGGGATGRAQHKPVIIRKLSGASSLSFYEALVRGEHLRKVTIAAKKKGKGKQEYLVITLQDVLVTSYNTSGGDGDKPTVETIALDASSIQLAHPPSGKVVIAGPAGVSP
jgi:type VI secretion system secreted protein Hcp